MTRVVLLGLLLMAVPASAAPSPAGTWLTQNREGVVRVYFCGAALCADVAGLMIDHPSDPTPTDYRGVSQCHLPLITDAQPVAANLWKGHIADPRNGRVYGVEMRLDAHGNLAIRGFLGIPLLGQTQTWTRYAGRVPPDCRLQAGGLPSGRDRSE